MACEEISEESEIIFYQRCAAHNYKRARGEYKPDPYQSPFDDSYIITAQAIAANDSKQAREQYKTLYPS